jgi:thioredoxin 1
MAGSVLEFTDANWKSEVLESPVPVLVDFWAAWCGPCKALGPTITKLAEEYEGRVKVGKVDTDKYQDLAAQYGVSAIPTVLVFQNGDTKDRFQGVNSQANYQGALAKLGV